MSANRAIKELLTLWSQHKAARLGISPAQWPGPSRTTQAAIASPRPHYPPTSFAGIIQWREDVAHQLEPIRLDSEIGSVVPDSSSDISEENAVGDWPPTGYDKAVDTDGRTLLQASSPSSSMPSLLTPDSNLPANVPVSYTPWTTPPGETHLTFTTLTTAALRKLETANVHRLYVSPYPPAPAAFDAVSTRHELVFAADPAGADEESELACPGFYIGADGETWPLPPPQPGAALEDVHASPQSTRSLSALGKLWYKMCGPELRVSLAMSSTAIEEDRKSTSLVSDDDEVRLTQMRSISPSFSTLAALWFETCGAEWGVSPRMSPPSTRDVEQQKRLPLRSHGGLHEVMKRPTSPSFSELGAQWYATFGPELGVFLPVRPASPIPLAASVAASKENGSQPESELSSLWCVGEHEEVARELVPRLGFDVAKMMHRLENLHFVKTRVVPAAVRTSERPNTRRAC
ncbi:hypothetical protein C8Q80DRAFT_1205447 [Daedaleopsis nitida]|nr:hypothetical protein C8Q80DRAFT_1205447 [Daedaleopsis nitida]